MCRRDLMSVIICRMLICAGLVSQKPQADSNLHPECCTSECFTSVKQQFPCVFENHFILCATHYILGKINRIAFATFAAK
jgi:hypothetical protein